MKTPDDLVAFLEWQSSRRGEGEEQRKFREDALAFPHLLVFAVMRKKSPFIHLAHSVGIYPNIPGADPSWKGKIIGFLGDRTRYASPQLVELSKNVAWAWDDPLVSRDSEAMLAHQRATAASPAFWTPAVNAPRTRAVVPRMLALPPDCVTFCAEARRTPAELFQYITESLTISELDPRHYALVLDWCTAAAHAGTGPNASSSTVSFAMPAIVGCTDHLHEWAHNRLTITLPPAPDNAHSGNSSAAAGTRDGISNNQPQIEVGLLAQVTAAVLAAVRAGNGQEAMPAGIPGRAGDECKPYSEYQLAKLKGFCCVRTNAGLPEIWDYFKSTKEVDAHRTQLVEEMKRWATANEVQINRGIYFDKSTMDDFVKMDFCPGTPTAYITTAEQGISILICRPRMGNETADIRSKEQAALLTARNHTFSDALLLSRRDPRQPAASYHELKLDLGTFCALLAVLFGEKCDYFDNCFALLRMMDSDCIFANAHNFTPLMCRQVTWAIINDSRQYFFRTLTADQFLSGQVRWPTSLLMQIIGADIQACREIRMGNFPDKWRDSATVGSLLRPASDGVGKTNLTGGFALPPGLPPAPNTQWATPLARAQPTRPDNTPSGQQDKPVLIRGQDIHPAFTQLMSGYITHFRSVQWKTLLKAGKLTEAELPTIPAYVKNGKNTLCYAYILGKCQGKMCGRAPDGHAPASAISDDFAHALCGSLSSAVQHRLATEPPLMQGQYSGSYSSKRFKRTA
jgi:hypothetical protein